MLPTQPVPVMQEMNQQRKVLVIAAVAVSILLITTLIAITTTVIVLRNQKPIAPVTPPEVATPAAIPVPPPSRFATDAGVLSLREAIATLSGKVDSIDLFETDITPPNLDLNLNIAPQR